MNKKIILSVGILVIIFLAWFGWMSISQAKSIWIETKVQHAMTTSMQRQSPRWPRIEMHNAGEVYYTPIVNDPAHDFDLTRSVLELLNQDASVPPIKLINLTLSADYQSAVDTLNCQAYITFPFILGVNKTILVRSAIPMPRYQALR